MNRTSPAPPCASRPTTTERATVLGGFAVAALCTALAGPLDAGMETVAAAWLVAAAWAFLSSLALAIRRGLRHRDWRAFGRCGMTDGTELVDWSTRTGEYAWMAVAEEHERLMRGD